jgi:uncharacterized protein YbjT (DUF2867 family)
MSRVVIIGGSGHVGTYLVPRLVAAGFEVVNVSRGKRAAYQPATDVAIVTSFGPCTLAGFNVITLEVTKTAADRDAPGFIEPR